MAKKKQVITNAMRLLQTAKVDFKAVEYETDGTVEENFGMLIAEKTGIPAEKSFKTLVVRGERQGILVACVPVCRELDLKKLAKAAGDKNVEMIHVRELLGLTGYVRGGVSPVGMKKKYPTFIDESCMRFDTIAISAGICGCTLLMRPADVARVTAAQTADIVCD